MDYVAKLQFDDRELQISLPGESTEFEVKATILYTDSSQHLSLSLKPVFTRQELETLLGELQALLNGDDPEDSVFFEPAEPYIRFSFVRDLEVFEINGFILDEQATERKHRTVENVKFQMQSDKPAFAKFVSELSGIIPR